MRKSSYTKKEFHQGQHRFEHWYRDNTVYFITSRVADQSAAFASERAKQIFWDRFRHYAIRYGFEAWVATLMDNHYHFIGYMPVGENLGAFMQHLHGSVAKLVNDLLAVRPPVLAQQGEQGLFRWMLAR